MAKDEIHGETVVVDGSVLEQAEKSVAESLPEGSEEKVVAEALEVEGVVFASGLKPPGSTNQLILAGAGARGLEINGVFIKFTSIGIYIDKGLIQHLSAEYKGKTSEDLYKDDFFIEKLVKAPQEKFARVVLLAPLTGVQYSEKVLERIQVQALYTDLQDKHRQQFLEAFKGESFPPGSSVLLSASPFGLKIGFSKDNVIPETPVAVVEDQSFAEAVLATIIWKDGVSPAARLSLSERLSKWL